MKPKRPFQSELVLRAFALFLQTTDGALTAADLTGSNWENDNLRGLDGLEINLSSRRLAKRD